METFDYKANKSIKLVTTADGSNSLFVPELNEQYHSYHGARQESEHVFIKNGLIYKYDEHFIANNKIKILEIGFGTGLNGYLTYLQSLKLKVLIEYVGIEVNPLPINIIKELNYAELLGTERELFLKMHECEWEKYQTISENFSLKKQCIKVQDIIFDEKFDIIYYDAFGPRAQAEMWQFEIFLKLFDALNSGGILVTYCAKGEVKRLLKSVGFVVENIPGPPGKREMTRAHKP